MNVRKLRNRASMSAVKLQVATGQEAAYQKVLGSETTYLKAKSAASFEHTEEEVREKVKVSTKSNLPDSL
jgi:hypothetical protein